jgi:hypothetical protein
MKTRKRDTGIWLVNKERKYLILKFSAGKYRYTQGEFSSPKEFLEDRRHSKTGNPLSQ